jgi:hypothetical protein
VLELVSEARVKVLGVSKAMVEMGAKPVAVKKTGSVCRTVAGGGGEVWMMDHPPLRRMAFRRRDRFGLRKSGCLRTDSFGG